MISNMYEIIQERDQYKKENEELKESFQYQLEKRLEYFKKYKELKEENDKLINQIEDNDLELLEDVRHYSIKCKDLEKENKKLKEENKKLKDKIKRLK